MVRRIRTQKRDLDDEPTLVTVLGKYKAKIKRSGYPAELQSKLRTIGRAEQQLAKLIFRETPLDNDRQVFKLGRSKMQGMNMTNAESKNPNYKEEIDAFNAVAPIVVRTLAPMPLFRKDGKVRKVRRKKNEGNE